MKEIETQLKQYQVFYGIVVAGLLFGLVVTLGNALVLNISGLSTNLSGQQAAVITGLAPNDVADARLQAQQDLNKVLAGNLQNEINIRLQAETLLSFIEDEREVEKELLAQRAEELDTIAIDQINFQSNNQLAQVNVRITEIEELIESLELQMNLIQGQMLLEVALFTDDCGDWDANCANPFAVSLDEKRILFSSLEVERKTLDTELVGLIQTRSDILST